MLSRKRILNQTLTKVEEMSKNLVLICPVWFLFTEAVPALRYKIKQRLHQTLVKNGEEDFMQDPCNKGYTIAIGEGDWTQL